MERTTDKVVRNTKNIDYKPIFGNKRASTHWLVFMKVGES